MENIIADYQDRIFLLLKDDSKETRLIKDILKSPLGLASDIIRFLFEEKFGELKDSLDDIKRFAAGINRSEKLSIYPLASYYPYMFAFHQYFHSSYRARQGKVLEKMLQNILVNYGNCDGVPNKNNDMLTILMDVFDTAEIPKLDLDAMGFNSSENKIILIQIRSRDDTGGTTAKGSLVDMLRALLRINKIPNSDILYLVCVWEPRNSAQKNSTIKKIYSSIQDLITINEKDFSSLAFTPIKLRNRIFIRMVYGIEEISQSLYDWIGSQNKEVLKSIYNIITTVEDWDDLWISYTIASMELENMLLSGNSNIKILNDKYKQVGIDLDFKTYDDLNNSIVDILSRIIILWKENSIPLASTSDRVHYIRDLLFLKACYEKLIRKGIV